MGNLALCSAEEPDDLRATSATVEVPTQTDNNAALSPGARPNSTARTRGTSHLSAQALYFQQVRHGLGCGNKTWLSTSFSLNLG